MGGGIFGSDYDWATGAAQQNLEKQWESLKEEGERFYELGLTGYVKYGYHEIIDYLPDEVILLYGKTNAFVCVSSVVEAEVLDGSRENLDQYILINARGSAKGVTDGIWDNTLGQWENLILAVTDIFKKLVIDPSQYVRDALSGNVPEEGWEQGFKVSLSLLQMATGIPVFTAAQQTEKDINQLKEAAEKFKELIPLTPEEWITCTENAVTRICRTAEKAREMQEQLATLTPEEWAGILENTLNALEEQAKAYCTEENIEALNYDTGYVEGSVIGILIEEIFEIALGAEIGKMLEPKLTKGVGAAEDMEDGVTAGLKTTDHPGIGQADNLPETAGADCRDINGLAKAGEVLEGGTDLVKFNIDEIRPQLKTEPDTAFFWSGKTDGVGGAEVAADIAKGKGGVTLESTIEAKDITMPEWDFNDPSSMDAWDMASAAYAEQVSGEVRAVVGTELRPDNIWENVELPRLMENPNVTKITIIDPKTGIETVIFER